MISILVTAKQKNLSGNIIDEQNERLENAIMEAIVLNVQTPSYDTIVTIEYRKG